MEEEFDTDVDISINVKSYQDNGEPKIEVTLDDTTQYLSFDERLAIATQLLYECATQVVDIGCELPPDELADCYANEDITIKDIVNDDKLLNDLRNNSIHIKLEDLLKKAVSLNLNVVKAVEYRHLKRPLKLLDFNLIAFTPMKDISGMHHYPVQTYYSDDVILPDLTQSQVALGFDIIDCLAENDFTPAEMRKYLKTANKAVMDTLLTKIETEYTD